MKGESGQSAVKRTASVNIGGVALRAGFYLPSGANAPVKKRPDKKSGYAHFDGETLTLRNYRYSGAGAKVGSVNVGIDLSNATTELVFHGENTIEIIGAEKSAALMINDGKTTMRGKGSLSLYARGGRKSNFAMLGSGTVQICSGTVKLQTEVGEYSIGDEGQRIYAADSYAVKLGKLIARGARIRGYDGDIDENGKKKRRNLEISEMNRNNETEIIIDFPRALFWWWRRGSLGQLLLLLLALLAIGAAVWILRNPEIIEPDYNMLEVDENAEEMPPDGTPVESTGGGGSITLNFSYDVTVSLSKKKASLYFGLPSQSNKDAVLQLIVDDLLVAQSGRLPPGYQVSTLTVRSEATRRLKAGAYNGVLRVLYYNDDTGERAILDTEIDVTINVTD